MKRLLVCTLLAALLFAPTLQAQDNDNYAEKAGSFITLLDEAQWDAAVAMFDSVMAERLPLEKLSQTWLAITGQLGPLKEQKFLRTDEQGAHVTAFIRLTFEQASADARITFAKSGKIAGFFIAPVQADAAKDWTLPDYADTAAYAEEKVTFGVEGWELPGIITVPKAGDQLPAVVLVHGSGPNDMDETLGPNKPFKDIALGLASQGIAVFRYNKRTKEYPTRFMETPDFTVDDETVEDALYALEFIRGHERVDPDQVYLLGHSLGAMMAPRIASEDTALAGVIMLSTPARPLEDLYMEQVIYVDSLRGGENEDFVVSVREQVAMVKSDELGSSTSSDLLPMQLPASYWLDLRGYSVHRTAEMLPMPLLFLQGERDYQVTMEDYSILRDKLNARDDVTFKSYPNLNHLFIKGKGKATPDEYMQAGHVALRVIDDIAEWIKTTG